MTKTLYEISKELIPSKNAKSFLINNENNKSLITSFYDPKITATQCFVDTILYSQSKYPYSIDITEFFRISESFKTGYSQIDKIISPVIEFNLSNDIEKDSLINILNNYSSALLNDDLSYLEKDINFLADIGSKKSQSLFKKTYFEIPNERPLFHNKKVIVTGSDTGIGREIAIEFSKRGANLVMHYPNKENSKGTFSALEFMKENGINAKAIYGDFRTVEGIYDFANKSMNEGIDILINNAGITLNKPFLRTNLKDLEEILNVNLKSHYILSQKAIEIMNNNKKGVIINMSSNHGISGKAGHSLYAMTKGGINAFTRAIAMEYAREGIRINTISPGWVMNHRLLNAFPNYSKICNNPMKHWNNSEDIAILTANYCSDESKNITGQNIIIDCGISIAFSEGGDATAF